MTWGTKAYGTSTYGGTGGALTVTKAVAISTHEVLVTLSRPPMNRTGILPGDVSNPNSWSVTVPATGQLLQIAGVSSYESPLSWVVRTLDRLPDSTGTGLITATQLLDAGGSTAGLPNSASFAGVTELAISTPAELAATRTRAGRDLKNAPAPQVGGSVIGGTLEVAGGDYVLEGGVTLARKMVGRRLMVRPGELFHIPNFGVGIEVKQPLPGGSLAKLQARAERQIGLEPGMSNVSVTMVQDQNTLTVEARATLAKTGQQVNVALYSPIGQGR